MRIWSAMALSLSACGGPQVEVVEPSPNGGAPDSIFGYGPDDFWMGYAGPAYTYYDGEGWTDAPLRLTSNNNVGYYGVPLEPGSGTLLVSDEDGVYLVDGAGVEALAGPEGVAFGVGGTPGDHALGSDHGRPFVLAGMGAGNERTSFVYEDGAWTSSPGPDAAEVLHLWPTDDGGLVAFTGETDASRLWSFEDGAWTESAAPAPFDLSTSLGLRTLMTSTSDIWIVSWVLGSQDPEFSYTVTIDHYDGAAWEHAEVVHTSPLGRQQYNPWLTTDAKGDPVMVVFEFDNRNGKGHAKLVGVPIRSDLTLGSAFDVSDLRDFCGDFCLELPPVGYSRLDDGSIVVGRHDLRWDVVSL